jgi:hypothetical protein
MHIDAARQGWATFLIQRTSISCLRLSQISYAFHFYGSIESVSRGSLKDALLALMRSGVESRQDQADL